MLAWETIATRNLIVISSNSLGYLGNFLSLALGTCHRISQWTRTRKILTCFTSQILSAFLQLACFVSSPSYQRRIFEQEKNKKLWVLVEPCYTILCILSRGHFLLTSNKYTILGYLEQEEYTVFFSLSWHSIMSWSGVIVFACSRCLPCFLLNTCLVWVFGEETRNTKIITFQHTIEY